MKKRILEIIGDSSLAGAPRHLLGLLENFDYKKFEISVISPPGPLVGEIRSLDKDVKVEIIPMPSRLDLKAISEIRKEIKHLKPDIIHVHGTRAGSLGRFAAIGIKIPLIYTEHLWTENYKLKSKISQFFQIAGLWFLDMFTTANIAVSQSVKDFMIDNQISRPDKIKVIYNGITPSKKKAVIFKKSDIILGTVGTLNIQKGIQFLISALPIIHKEYPNVYLVIIGEGPYRANLEKEAKKLKLKNKVTFRGFVKDIDQELIDFDIYVQPSLSESFGLAIVQAMSLGLPIIATNAGGIPEVVTTGKSGILVEPGSAKALADGILELIRNKAEAKVMGELAAEEAKIKFNLVDMTHEVEKIYEKMA